MITFAASEKPVMKKLLLGLFAILAFTASVSAQKFGFVDSQYILENIPEYKKGLGLPEWYLGYNEALRRVNVRLFNGIQ